MLLKDILKELIIEQTKELLTENFGTVNSRYHTTDEIPFYKLIAKINKTVCPVCGKTFVLNLEGGAEIDGAWICLNCYWSD
jgi:ribosomal protein L37AE/L43A